MDYEFHRVDYLICGITYPHTLKILPSSGKSVQKPPRYLLPFQYLTTTSCGYWITPAFNNKEIIQFAIGDKNGVLQCISIKDEEPIVQFKTLPGKPITSVIMTSGEHGEKIFAASGNEVNGYTRKGKLFFTIETAFIETITSMSIVGSELILCSGKTITFYSDMQESYAYTCEDRVLDIAAFETPNSTKLRILILIANKGTALLENGQLMSRITISSGPCRLVVLNSGHNTEVFSFYGANDGSIGIIRYEKQTLSSQSLFEGQSLGSVICLGWYNSNGNKHLAVGRQDGSVQLYLIDKENLSEKPRLKFTYFCGEPITSINGGCFGTEEQELLVVSFSGRIFSLRPGQQPTTAALSKLPRDALTARRNKLETEIARLEKQTANEREKYQRSTQSLISTLSTPPLLDIQYEIIGATRDSSVEIRLVSAVPLDMLFVYCQKKLILETDSLAVLSVCPSQENSKDLLATVRCQADTRRLWVRMHKDLPEAESVSVLIYVLPSGAPRVSRVIEVTLPVLDYYSQQEDLICENQTRPWCELRVTGKFSVAEITSWLTDALPGDIPRPATTVSFARSHALVGTLLVCHYQRGVAILKSDDVSTIAVLRSVITNCSMKKSIRIDIVCDVPQNYLLESFKLLEYIMKAEYQKKRDCDLGKAIGALDLEINSMNTDGGQLLCDEYMIINTKQIESESNHFQKLADIVYQWNIDWNMLLLNRDNANTNENLKILLLECNLPDILKILSKDPVSLP